MPDKFFTSQTEAYNRPHDVQNENAPAVLGIRVTPKIAKRWLETMQFVRAVPSVRSYVVEQAWEWHLVYLDQIMPPWIEQPENHWTWQEAHIYGNHVRLVAINTATHARCVGTAYIWEIDLDYVLEGEDAIE